jgi:hypothetical protein
MSLTVSSLPIFSSLCVLTPKVSLDSRLEGSDNPVLDWKSDHHNALPSLDPRPSLM